MWRRHLTTLTIAASILALNALAGLSLGVFAPRDDRPRAHVRAEIEARPNTGRQDSALPAGAACAPQTGQSGSHAAAPSSCPDGDGRPQPASADTD